VSEHPPCRRKVCGHPAEMHVHWRAGDDCGTCGRNYCPSYLGPTVWSRLRVWLRG